MCQVSVLATCSSPGLQCGSWGGRGEMGARVKLGVEHQTLLGFEVFRCSGFQVFRGACRFSCFQVFRFSGFLVFKLHVSEFSSFSFSGISAFHAFGFSGFQSSISMFVQMQAFILSCWHCCRSLLLFMRFVWVLGCAGCAFPSMCWRDSV